MSINSYCSVFGMDGIASLIGWDLSCTCIVTSWLGRQRSKHYVLVKRLRATCHVYHDNLAPNATVNVMKCVPIYKGRDEYSRQAKLFLKKLQFPKFPFYRKFILLSSHPNSNKQIVINYYRLHNDCGVVGHATVCCDMMTSSPFYYYVLTLIPAWICNHIHYKIWDEINNPFLNFNGATIKV